MENTKDTVENPQNTTTPEVLVEGGKVEKSVETTELSPENKLNNVEEEIQKQENEITKLADSVNKTKEELNKLREELGLPQAEEEAPSILFGNKNLEKLKDKKDGLEKEKEGILSEIDKAEKLKEEKVNQPEKKEEQKEISEGTLAELSESINIKNNLELKVGALRQSPEIKILEEASAVLQEKRNRLEGLKNVNKDGSISVSGSVSVGGNSSISFEGGLSQSESLKDLEETKEKVKIDLQREAENLLEKTRIQILKLEKEEMVYSSEGLEIKRGEIEVETNKVEAETEIWKTSGMDQKTFNEGLQKIDSPDGESQDFENKELFLKFKAANTEAENHKNQNKGYYENIDAKQKEIDAREQSAGDLETPNENKILEALNSEKKEESQEKKEEEIPAKEENIAPSAEVANSEETIENSPVDVEEGVIDTKVNA